MIILLTLSTKNLKLKTEILYPKIVYQSNIPEEVLLSAHLRPDILLIYIETILLVKPKYSNNHLLKKKIALIKMKDSSRKIKIFPKIFLN